MNPEKFPVFDSQNNQVDEVESEHEQALRWNSDITNSFETEESRLGRPLTNQERHKIVERYAYRQMLGSERPNLATELPTELPEEVLGLINDAPDLLTVKGEYARVDDILWLESRLLDGFHSRAAAQVEEESDQPMSSISEAAQIFSSSAVQWETEEIVSAVRNGQYESIFDRIAHHQVQKMQRKDIRIRHNGKRVFFDDLSPEEQQEVGTKAVWNFGLEQMLTGLTGIEECSKEQFIEFCRREIPIDALPTRRGVALLLDLSKICGLDTGDVYGKGNSADVAMVLDQDSITVAEGKSRFEVNVSSRADKPSVKAVILPVEQNAEGRFVYPYVPITNLEKYGELFDTNYFAEAVANYYIGLYVQAMTDVSKTHPERVIPAYDLSGKRIF